MIRSKFGKMVGPKHGAGNDAMGTDDKPDASDCGDGKGVTPRPKVKKKPLPAKKLKGL